MASASIASRPWIGTKILKAAEMRAAGAPIAIVSEVHWTQHL
jgi:hypothetical protein